MVEAGANEMPEAEILDALDIAHSEIKKLCAAQRELREGRQGPSSRSRSPKVDEGLLEQIKDSHGRSSTRPRRSRTSSPARTPTKAVEEEVLAQYSGARGRSRVRARRAARRSSRSTSSRRSIIRERIAMEKKRPDGRGTDEIRAITIEAGLPPRTHGSALFTRGQTQALSVAALGTTREEMRLDTLGLETSKRYFHHYNFPPFSVGEAGFMRGPKRRESATARSQSGRSCR